MVVELLVGAFCSRNGQQERREARTTNCKNHNNKNAAPVNPNTSVSKNKTDKSKTVDDLQLVRECGASTFCPQLRARPSTSAHWCTMRWRHQFYVYGYKRPIRVGFEHYDTLPRKEKSRSTIVFPGLFRRHWRFWLDLNSCPTIWIEP